MKTIIRLFTISLLLLVAHPTRGNIIGYVNYQFYPGDNLFHNCLLNTDNHLSTLFTSAPGGTTVSLWDTTANAYGPISTYDSVNLLWSVDLELTPGIGARLTSPSTSTFINTFVGTVLNHDGSLCYDDDFPHHLPTPFTGPGGVYLLGDKLPLASSGTDIFLYILGRAPEFGEQVTRLDAATQKYTTSTYLDNGLGSGYWDIVPSIAVGEAAFFTLVPEPSATALSLVGLALLRLRRR